MDWQKNPPKKVLMINIFGIGDVLFTTPLISNLKKNFPDTTVGYMCNRRTVCVLENNPHIEKIFVYERDELMAIYRKSKIAYFKELNKFFQSIRQENYDAVIDVSLNRFTSFLTWVVGIKQRVGFNFKNRGFLLNNKIDLIAYEEKPVVEYYFDLLKRLNVPVTLNELQLYITDQDRAFKESFFKTSGINGEKPLIGIFPGGGASWGKDAVYKRWPPENYAKLADYLIENCRAEIILFGGENERDVCESVSRTMKHPRHTACGKTTITQFAALAQSCRLIILNDGGPLHVAVAAKARTVSLFGPVDDLVYGPYPIGDHKIVKKDLACRPCYRRFKRAHCEHVSCLKTISVEDVLEKVKELL